MLSAHASHFTLSAALPEPPDSQQVPYLDAAVRCVERFGWSRTTARDIAREAGVERTTIYRHLGNKADILRLLVAREVHTLILGALAAGAREAGGPPAVVEVLASAVEYVWNHAAINKLLNDDPELLSGFLVNALGDTIERFADALAPLLRARMHAGKLAERDPVAVTQWLVRVGLTLLVARPPGDLRTFLASIIEPALRPQDA